MTIQARMSPEDKRLYNPSRDVAHNFQQVMTLVAARLEDAKWPELNEILKRENVSIDDLGDACGAYCTYIANGVNDPKLSMFESLDKSGFFQMQASCASSCLGDDRFLLCRYSACGNKRSHS